jgi:hypothetical protein
VPPPWLVFRCDSGGPPRAWSAGGGPKPGAPLALRPPRGSQARVLWPLPAGNLDHGPFVALATTAALLACSGAVVWAALSNGNGGATAAKAKAL